jgi:hypothetical protein
VFLVFAAGLDFLLLSFIIYAPGTVLFVMSRRSRTGVLFPGRAGHLRDRHGRGHCRHRRPGDRRDHHLGRTE